MSKIHTEINGKKYELIPKIKQTGEIHTGDFIVKTLSLHDGRLNNQDASISNLQDTTNDISRELEGKLDKDGDGSNVIVSFPNNSERENINNGENLSSLFNKIKKWFADLKPIAFSNDYHDLENKPELATQYTDGLMSSFDKRKLNNSEFGAQVNIIEEIKCNGETLIANDKTVNIEVPIKPEDIGAESIENKGKPEGYAPLDENGKVPLFQISDAILGQMVHAGEFNASTATATLTTNGQTFLGIADSTIILTNDESPITGFDANQGNYFITTVQGTFASTTFAVGDWLVANASGWGIVKNTDAVTGVKGSAETTYRLGNVNITKNNIGLDKVLNIEQAPASHVGSIGTTQHGLGNGNIAGFSTNDYTTSEKNILADLFSRVNELPTNIPNIQSGVKELTMTSTNNVGSYSLITVAFPTEFNTVPVVTITLQYDGAYNYNNFKLTNVTTSYFTFSFGNQQQTTYTRLYVNWIAVRT